MRFISAGALWWLWLGVPIIVLYLLKLKRSRHVVSSVLLWRRAIQEMEANVPFRKLRRNLLLILQLAALALIVLALSRPAVTSHALAQGSTVLVVDATASMGARDENNGSETRLER
ncbi:MAG TPA: BatA domain-containing protein, partial [Blastocatellia bacterium]|nr:BatA domain-containing protein [Blastocatellia bacterium]